MGGSGAPAGPARPLGVGEGPAGAPGGPGGGPRGRREGLRVGPGALGGAGRPRGPGGAPGGRGAGAPTSDPREGAAAVSVVVVIPGVPIIIAVWKREQAAPGPRAGGGGAAESWGQRGGRGRAQARRGAGMRGRGAGVSSRGAGRRAWGRVGGRRRRRRPSASGNNVDVA